MSERRHREWSAVPTPPGCEETKRCPHGHDGPVVRPGLRAPLLACPDAVPAGVGLHVRWRRPSRPRAPCRPPERPPGRPRPVPSRSRCASRCTASRWSSLPTGRSRRRTPPSTRGSPSRSRPSPTRSPPRTSSTARSTPATPPDLFLTRQTALPRWSATGPGAAGRRAARAARDRVRRQLPAARARGVRRRLGAAVHAQRRVALRRLLQQAAARVRGCSCQPGEPPPTPAARAGPGSSSWTAPGRCRTTGSRASTSPPRLTTLMPLMRSAGEDIVDDPRDPDDADALRAGDPRRARAGPRPWPATPTSPRRPRQLSPPGRGDPLRERASSAMMIGTRALVPAAAGDARPVTSTSTRCRAWAGSATVAEMTGYCISRDSEHVADDRGLPGLRQRRRGLGDPRRVGRGRAGQPRRAALAGVHRSPSKFPRNSLRVRPR